MQVGQKFYKICVFSKPLKYKHLTTFDAMTEFYYGNKVGVNVFCYNIAYKTITCFAAECSLELTSNVTEASF